MFQNFSIKQSYTVIFIILIFWASIAYYTMNTLIDSQSYYAKLINLSGKQRMLSQKSAFLASKHLQNPRRDYLNLLKNSISELEQNHSYITQKLSNKAYDFYFKEPSNLDKKAKNYINLLKKFLFNPTFDLESDIFKESQKLLEYLDDAVAIFQNESETKTKELQQREFFIFLGTIFTILIEAHFFARPVIEKMKIKFQDFYEKLRQKDNLIDLQTKFFQNAHEGIVITNKENHIIDLNHAFETVTGFKKYEILGKNPSILKSGEHNEDFYNAMWENIKEKGFYKGEIINRKKNGEKYVQNISIFALKDENGNIINYFALVSDITESYLTQKQLYNLANYDTLTGIYNRRSFYEKLKLFIDEHKRSEKKFALIYIDLDDFKNINDTLGHDYGDIYLVKFSKLLQEVLRKNDLVARVGGDEFIVILNTLDSSEGVRPFFHRLFSYMKNPIMIKNHPQEIKASFGISMFPDDGNASNQLVKYADLAMYESKRNGKNQYTFYNVDFEQKLLKELQLEKDIRTGLQNKEFIMYMQPKIDLANDKIAGVEMLIRWEKEGKLIYPDSFIPFCEKSNLIVEIGNEVFDQVISLVKKWNKQERFKNLNISFNLSSKQILDKHFKEKILENKEFLLSKESILIAEITEHSIVEDFENMKNFLHFLKECNIKIALDDFGTGYSSLGYLKILPIDYLKIDKEFTFNIFKDEKDSAITKTIINLAKNLKLDIIAEGVETKEHIEFFKENGCKYAQGYYYSKAVSPESFESLVS